MKLTAAQERALVALLDLGATSVSMAVTPRRAGTRDGLLLKLRGKYVRQEWAFDVNIYWLSRRGLAEAKRLKGEG